MKKIISTLVSLIVLIALIIDGYWLFFKQKITSATTQTTTSQSTASSQDNSSTTNQTNANQYKDGTYTGKATSTQWGDVQVQATVKNGKLSAINVLEYPNENGHDQQINQQALPIYKSEALKKQSAKISLVSGASETYKGFTGSLQNALTQAEG